jgi:adenylylsulfate kinase
MACEIIGKQHFFEVFVNTPIEICEQRDVKGLYKKARAGEIKDFTGINAPFEAPTQANAELKTENRSPEESAQELYELVINQITY